ncbi:restriction endonuclease [Christiangramia crocea]|uniref:Restriction endonuclease n=1 Tax=Christiangramia crocea TaxID=2904124 RepID=A0A9X1UYL5_9FLAO|nr:restriction endonuclease [Gramella crocea]MCG9972802.1 restriction endonuclease [Gramella crocea]
MQNTELDIIKSSGDKVKFSLSKLRNSLLKSGADKKTVKYVLDEMRNELYQGISTREIYNRAFALLKEVKSVYASKYKLKKAIYELGPTGFPFEKYIGSILSSEGYKILLNQSLTGKCVKHEIDIIAIKDSVQNLIECKFHSEEGRNCDVKVPLYIYARFTDIKEMATRSAKVSGWLITNTRFSEDAVQYAKCVGLKLISWNYPEKHSLKQLIDQSKLYPITVSTLLSEKEKDFLLQREVVLGSDLLKNEFLLDHLGISDSRKSRILSEFNILCTKTKSDGS